MSRPIISSQIILIAIILFACCTRKKEKPAVTWLYGYGEIDKLNGRVKTLTDNRWSYSKTLPYFNYSFDAKGNLIKVDDILKGQINTAKYTTVYNKNGNKTESIGTYNSEGKSYKEIFKYDYNGYLTRYVVDSEEKSADTSRFTYDKTGNLIEHDYYFEKKPLWIVKYQYVYDKAGVCKISYHRWSTWRDNFKTANIDTTLFLTFDNKNNWLKAVAHGDTVTRKITYY